MNKFSTLLMFFLLSICVRSSQGLMIPTKNTPTLKRNALSVVMSAENGNDNNVKGKGLISDFFDMFKNLDDVAEDFFYKRMGKGEIFYGKRKYKPSGDVEVS